MKKHIKQEIKVNGRIYELENIYPSFLMYHDKEIKTIRTCIPWVDTGLIPVGHPERPLKERDTSNYCQDEERRRWFV